jgi:hypothetical protein
VLVHPSLTEAFGVAAIEAQAMGLPVVCSDAGGLPENVEDGVTGFVVARRDTSALADRLQALASDPALRRGMGRAARLRAESEFSLERQLDGFEAIYEQLLAMPREAAGDPVAAGAAARRERVDALRGELAELESRRDDLERRLWRREVVEEVRAWVARALPAGAHVLVVSRGDEDIVAFPDHRGAHYPQAAGGAYAGHHPADSADAIAQLEALRAAGAEYLVVPATSAWWLDHYEDLARHLESEGGRIASAEDRYVAFALTAAAGAPDARPAQQVGA